MIEAMEFAIRFALAGVVFTIVFLLGLFIFGLGITVLCDLSRVLKNKWRRP